MRSDTVSSCNTAWLYRYNETIPNEDPNPTATICGKSVTIHKKSLTWSSRSEKGKCYKVGKEGHGKVEECNPEGVAVCTWTEEIECTSHICC